MSLVAGDPPPPLPRSPPWARLDVDDMEQGGEKARTEGAEEKMINLGINLANNELGNATYMACNTNLRPLFLPPFAKFVKQSYLVNHHGLSS